MAGSRARTVRAGAMALALALALLWTQGAGEAAGADEPITEACPAEVDGQRFADVASDAVHAAAIDCAAWWGIARGVGEDDFGPRGHVTRAQMASFVARLVRGSEGRLPASPADAFPDDAGSVHHYATNRLAAVAVLQGLGDGTYAPAAPVSRGQMASILVRALEQRTGQRLAASRDPFSDDDGSVHEHAINKAATAGLALGVAPSRFDPHAPVSRAQGASFLVRGLALVVDGGLVGDSPATLRRASALRAFDACEDLLGHYKEQALQIVGPYGLEGGRLGGVPVDGVPEPAPGIPGPVPAPSEGGPDTPTDAPAPEAPDFSDTNVQEEGVDESDIVKTDGRQLFTLAHGSLHRFDVTAGTPAPSGSLDVGGDAGELLLSGDRALVLAPSYVPHPRGAYEELAELTLVDVGQGADLAAAATLSIEGHPLSARMVDGVARVVVRSSPGLPFVFPDDSQPDPEAAATRANRAVIEASTIEDWLPRYTRTNASGETVADGALLACDQVARPPEFSGMDLLSVVTVDLAGDFTPEASAGVLAAGQTVYASTTGLYVATARWDFLTDRAGGEADTTTEIHAFDISAPEVATYTASGKVEGFILNQFALSEHDGFLRVATTAERVGDLEGSDSRVIVLQAQGSTLAEVGRVGGLGRGERIQAVRFLGDVGYVVTFRQVDPLYTIDLSDPTAPAVRGELKILGYSAYLHPIGEGLLLGVGVDADENGWRLGTQVSLFDVGDPADPQRLHQATVAGGSSEVEFDHRAFLWWAPLGRAVLPLQVFTVDDSGDQQGFVGAVGFDVDAGTGIAEAGRVTHAEGGDGDFWSTPGIRRSVVVGDALYTVSDRGVKASDLATLTDRAWFAYP